MSSVNIYSPEGMCSMTLFLASSESSSVFGISVFILNYFQLVKKILWVDIRSVYVDKILFFKISYAQCQSGNKECI